MNFLVCLFRHILSTDLLCCKIDQMELENIFEDVSTCGVSLFAFMSAWCSWSWGTVNTDFAKLVQYREWMVSSEFG